MPAAAGHGCTSLRAVSAAPPAVTELLQRLIRFVTVNPPGNEREANEHLAGILRDAGSP